MLVPPKLAKLIGLREAIILQQLHFWIWKEAGKIINGERWVWNSLDDWLDQFPFLTKKELRQTFYRLRQLELVKFSQHKKHQWDRTGWYTIDYQRLKPLQLAMCPPGHIVMPLGADQRAPGDTSVCPLGHINVSADGTSIRTETTPENSSEITLSPPTPPQEKERERDEQKCLEQEQEANQGNGMPKSTSAPQSSASLRDRPKSNAKPKDSKLDQSSGGGAALLQKNTGVLHDWEAEPGVPYPAFVKWHSQYYLEQGGHWAKAAIANARSEIRNNPQRAADLWQQFLDYSDRAADSALAHQAAGMKPTLPPCFQESPDPIKEDVAAKLAAIAPTCNLTPAPGAAIPSAADPVDCNPTPAPGAIAPSAAAPTPAVSNYKDAGENPDAYRVFSAEDFNAIPQSAPPEAFKAMFGQLVSKRSMSTPKAEEPPAAIFVVRPTVAEAREKWAALPLMREQMRKEFEYWDLEVVDGVVQEIPF